MAAEYVGARWNNIFAVLDDDSNLVSQVFVIGVVLLFFLVVRRLAGRAMWPVVLLLVGQPVAAHIITSAPELRINPTAYPGIGVGTTELFGQLPGAHLWKRQDQGQQCDPSSFFCPTGTCFTGQDGLVGCCTVSSCVPRTSCVPYTPGVISPCDSNTGGCLYCSQSEDPYCFYITNQGANQWINYCGFTSSTETISYANPITNSSGVDMPASVEASSTTSSSVSVAPTTTSQPSIVADATASSVEVAPGSGGFSSVMSVHTVAASSTSESPTPTSTNKSCLSYGLYSDPTPGSPYCSITPVSTSKTMPSGIIAGATVGGIAAILVMNVIMCYGRCRWCPGGHRPKGFEERKVFTGKKLPWAVKRDDAREAALRETAMRQAEMIQAQPSPSEQYSPDHFARFPEADSRTASIAEAPSQPGGLGISVVYPSLGSYRVSNLDYNHDELPAPRPGTVEAPVFSDRPLPKSPPVSSLASPGIAPSSSAEASPVSPFQPYTPSKYASSTYEPPTSIPRTSSSVPPSLPQHYSAASMGGTTLNGHEYESSPYRGTSASGQRPPWAYLSAEDARNGGWRNSEGVEEE